MSLRKLVLTSSLVVALGAAVPTRASAEWLFTPFIGATFGGNADVVGGGEDFENEFNQKFTYGGTLEWMGGGVFGFGVDFGYTPNFFGTDEFSLVGDGNVTTFMGNIIIGAPVGAVRPYVTGGVGLMKSQVDDVGQFFDQVDSTDWGLNAGGGIMGFFTDNIGIRGDIRYFRSMRDTDPDGIDLELTNFNFWRGSVGVTFRF